MSKEIASVKSRFSSANYAGNSEHIDNNANAFAVKNASTQRFSKDNKKVKSAMFYDDYQRTSHTVDTCLS